MFNQSAQRNENYDPNRVEEKPFPYEGIFSTFEKVKDYQKHREAVINRTERVDFNFQAYFNNQLEGFVNAIVKAAIESDYQNSSDFRAGEPVIFTYNFLDNYPNTDSGSVHKKPLLTTIIESFNKSTIFDFLMTVGVKPENIQLGELCGLNHRDNNINITFSYIGYELLNGIGLYHHRLLKEQEDAEFRKAVININTILVPKLEELYKLGHHLNDIERMFKLVDDLHTTFIKPKDK